MQLTITIPDTQSARVVTALSELEGWKATLADGTPNPETRAQAAKRRIIDSIKSDVRAYELRFVTDDLAIT